MSRALASASGHVPTVECHGRSETGLVRASNEDAYAVARLGWNLSVEQASAALTARLPDSWDAASTLICVADGMGGRTGGDRASQAAVSAVVDHAAHELPGHDATHSDPVISTLTSAFVESQACVERLARRLPDCRRMGSTLTVAYLLWPHVFVANVGDTRCYLSRGADLERLTRDHTLAQQLVDEGAMDAEDLGRSTLDHTLWNAISADETTELDPDIGVARLQRGDRILVCTDGLTGHVSDDELAQLLAVPSSVPHTCDLLVDLALSRGGRDNITTVVAQVG